LFFGGGDRDGELRRAKTKCRNPSPKPHGDLDNRLPRLSRLRHVVAVKVTAPTILDYRSGPLRTYDDLKKNCNEIKALLRLQPLWQPQQQDQHHYSPVLLLYEHYWTFLGGEGSIHRPVGNLILVSKVLDHDGAQANDFCGTSGYIAPEIYLGQPYGYEVDIAQGVITFRLLSGNRPFHSNNAKQLASDTINLRHTIMDNVWDGVTAEALMFVRKLLIGWDERLTAPLAVRHEWFRKREESS
jgi:serine/threonine protein kinase